MAAAPHVQQVPLKDRQLLHQLSNGNYCVLGSGVRYECDEAFNIIAQSECTVSSSGSPVSSQCYRSGNGPYYAVLDGKLYKVEEGDVQIVAKVPDRSFLVQTHDGAVLVDQERQIYRLHPFRCINTEKKEGKLFPIYNSRLFLQQRDSQYKFYKVSSCQCKRVKVSTIRNYIFGAQGLCLCKDRFDCGSVLFNTVTGESCTSEVKIDLISIMRILKATPNGFFFTENFLKMFKGYKLNEEGFKELSAIEETNNSQLIE